MSSISSLLRQLLAEPGEILDHKTRHQMQDGFRADFSRVRIHRSPLSWHVNRALRSRAFTFRDHIFFAHEAYQPDCPCGQRLITHEVAHVVQKQLGTFLGLINQTSISEWAAEEEADCAAEQIMIGNKFTCSVPL